MGLKLTNREFVNINARILKQPVLQFKKGTISKISDGKWNVADKKFDSTGNCSKLCLLWLSINDKKDATNHVKKAEDIALLLRNFGVNGGNTISAVCAKVKMPKRDRASGDIYRGKCQSSLNDGLNRLKKSEDPNPPLIVVALPNNDKELYSEVKRWGDCIQGIPTVCILQSKISSTNRRLRSNLW